MLKSQAREPYTAERIEIWLLVNKGWPGKILTSLQHGSHCSRELATSQQLLNMRLCNSTTIAKGPRSLLVHSDGQPYQ